MTVLYVRYLKGVRDYKMMTFVKDIGKDEEFMMMNILPERRGTSEKGNVTGLIEYVMFIDDMKQYDTYKANGAIVGDVDSKKAIDTSVTEEAGRDVSGDGKIIIQL